MENVGIFYGHLVCFMAVWHSLWSFGIVFLVWYVWTKKNLATLEQRKKISPTSEGVQTKVTLESVRQKLVCYQIGGGGKQEMMTTVRSSVFLLLRRQRTLLQQNWLSMYL
jgi:hypothetical protein